MKRIYLDTEYYYPGMLRGTPRPTAADKRQIVQIAAILVDSQTGEELAAFDQLVVPTYEKQVTDFFTELTGITQADINREGAAFSKVLSLFVEFAGNTEIYTFDKDEEVLRQNCGYTGIAWPFENSFTRVKALLPGYGVEPDKYSSGTLYEAAGLEMDGHVHNALHDVRSMAAAVRVFELA